MNDVRCNTVTQKKKKKKKLVGADYFAGAKEIKVNSGRKPTTGCKGRETGRKLLLKRPSKSPKLNPNEIL